MILANGTEIRSNEFGNTTPPPPGMGGRGPGGRSYAGKVVTLQNALGVTAISDAIRLIAETVAMLDLEPWKKDPDNGIDERAPDSWQFGLLENPSLDWTPFDWVQNAVADVEGYGNNFSQKIKDVVRGKQIVRELIPLDPDCVRIRVVKGAKVFDVYKDGKTLTLTPQDILHITGFRLGARMSGFSPIMLHANRIGAILALEEFSGRYFANDTATGLVMELPGNLSAKSAARHLRMWELSKAGVDNAHRPAIVYNGAKLSRVGLGLAESQFIQANEFGVAEVERMFRLPPGELQNVASRPDPTTAEQRALRLINLYLLPRMTRLTSALGNDPDLFLGAPEFPKFNTQKLMSVDALTQAQVEHLQIQDGSLLRDEARANRGQGPLPPVPDDPLKEPGKVPVLTPVGAGANPTPADASGTPAKDATGGSE